MRSHAHTLVTTLATVAFILSAYNPAHARETQSKLPSSGSDAYGYQFEDDPLQAGGLGPNDARIRVRPGGVRQTLIRPRTSFVPEMLKSVENL